MRVKTFRIVVISILALMFLTVLGFVVFFPRKDPTMVCMAESQFKKLSHVRPPPEQPAAEPAKRDLRVLEDPLYPPLNRTDSRNFDSIKTISINDIGDEYRLVGYLTNSDEHMDAGGNNWKLMARQKDRHTADFYIVPSNNNYDIKIPLTSEVVVSERLRDLYTIPTEMLFNSPMLNKTAYVFTELPKTDFSSRRYA